MLFSVEISLTQLLIASMDVPLNGFLSKIMSWSVFRPTCLSRLARCFLRLDIMHNFLFVYDLYSSLSRGVPFLDSFNTFVVTKATDR